MGGAIEHLALFSFYYTEGGTTRSAANFGIGFVALSAKKDASTTHLLFRGLGSHWGFCEKLLMPDLGCY